MQVIIRNRVWDLSFCKTPKDRDGDCSHPGEEKPYIRVNQSMKGQERLRILIHEMLHACLWDISEESVDESSTDMAKVLWDLGYRIKN